MITREGEIEASLWAWYSFSEFWVEILNDKDWVACQIEDIKKFYLGF